MIRKWRACLLAGCLAGGIALLAGVAPAGAASVINVATTGTDTPGCGAAAAPCATIQFAYGEAAAGDTIRVAAGTYAFAGLFVIQKSDLHLQGNMAGVDARTRTPGGPGETIIRPEPGSSLFGLWRVNASGVSIDGFTFADNTGGPAILTSDAHSGYLVTNDIFSHNSSGLRPGSNGGARSFFEKNLFVRNGSGVFTPDMFRNAVFADSEFEGDGSSPINLTLGAQPSERSSDIAITGNDIVDGTPVSLTGASDVVVTGNSMTRGFSGVQLTGGDHLIRVTDNRISDTTHGGVVINAAHFAATNTAITVAGNTLDHTVSVEGRFGIEISRSSDVSVRGNLILDTRYDGIGFTTRDQPVPSSDVTISQNTIVRSGGAAILVRDHAYSGPMTVRYNRIVDSGSGDGLVSDAPGVSIDARLNWWGCNHMPAGAGCDHLAGTAAGQIGFAPWLVLSIRSEPADIRAGQHATIIASLQHDSAGGTPGGPFFQPVVVTFTAQPGKVTPGQVTTDALLHARTQWPGAQPRPRTICASVDHQTQCLHFGPVSPVRPPKPPKPPTPPTLPVTGAPLAGLLTAGVSLIGVGLIALAFSRSRRRRFLL
jgi:Right handed beta helix region